jgi:beta-glucosidase
MLSRRGRVASLLVGAVAALVVAGALLATVAHRGKAEAVDRSSCPWVTSAAPPDVRAAEVVERMTLAQKVGVVVLRDSTTLDPHVHNGEDRYENVDTGIPSLCVPTLTLQDGPAGPAGTPAGTTVQLPAPIALGATFDPAMARTYGRLQADESKAKGIDAVQGPDINIDRVPEAGRNFETYGEDPYLSGALAVADIDGIQSQGELAVVKHFAGYNQETHRHGPLDDDIVSRRTLEEIYLPAFQAAVQEGRPAGVMCSYNGIDGTYACQDRWLLTQVLRDDWGYQGFIRSDSGAAHQPAAAFAAGLDAIKPVRASTIIRLVRKGRITETALDNAAVAVLTQMFAYGLFTKRHTGTPATDAITPAGLRTALAVAEEGSVLLRDHQHVLPVDRATVGSVAIIGGDTGGAKVTAPTASSSAYVAARSTVTPLDALRAALGRRVTTTFADGSNIPAAVTAARGARVAVVFVDAPEGEGEDLTSLGLPGGQDALVEAVAAANPRTVVVVDSGTAVLMPWLARVDAVLETWFPGQEDGRAVAALLLGQVDPSGKLPITFPRSDADAPVHTEAQSPGIDGRVEYSEGLDVGYRGYDAEHLTPLFPFGYGLSYTTFRFGGLRLSTARVHDRRFDLDAVFGRSAHLLTVSATVTNTGSRPGADVAQLYIGDPAVAGEPPRQLQGFERITLAPHQSGTVTFSVDARALSYWDVRAGGWVVAPGLFRIYVGDSSSLARLALRAQVTVTGRDPAA